jgi:phosphoglycerate dehydrogenase-like enzyme
MPAEKIHVHVENTRSKHELFHVTRERWDAAGARHRALARRLEASFGWDGDILDDAVAEAEIVIGVPARRERLAERAPRLRWLHATSAGVDAYLPLDWLPRGVDFTNNRGAHGVKAEQYMHMAYVMLNTRMAEIIADRSARRWRPVFSPSVIGRTALVVGLGDLGQAAVRAAAKLGMKVIGVSRTGKKVAHANAVYRSAALDRLLPQADVVVMAVPLTPETRHLLNRERMDRMKRSAGVINIARAPVADYDALRDKLTRGELAGAVLDVADPEPLPPEAPLWDTPSLILTPHISCDDGEHYVDISLDLWFENLARFLQRKPLKNRVDPLRGY